MKVLIFTGPPQIISKSPANITQLVERNVTLVCTVIADPNPTISWKHTDLDGKITEVKRTADKFDGNYTIYNARIEDSGKYSCNASNALGYEFYTAVITIKPGELGFSVSWHIICFASRRQCFSLFVRLIYWQRRQKACA